MRLQDVILRGTAAAQPAANTLSAGSLYYQTDTAIVQESDGTNWSAYSGANFNGTVVGNIPIANIASGTGASATTFLRGDNSWTTVVGGSTVGAVQSGMLQAWSRRAEWFYGMIGTTFSFGQSTINQANNNQTVNAAGVWMDLGSSVSGTISHMDDNSTFCWADHNPVWRTQLFTDAASIANTRFWGGLSQSAWADTDTPSTASGKCVGIRYSTVAGDTGFVAVCVDGSGQTTSSLIATVTANTQYILEIVVSATGTSALFTVYNAAGVVQGTPRTITTHIPTGQAFKSAIAIIPQTAGSRHWLFRGVYAEAN